MVFLGFMPGIRGLGIQGQKGEMLTGVALATGDDARNRSAQEAEALLDCILGKEMVDDSHS